MLWAPGKNKSSYQHGATSPSRKELATILLGCSPWGSEHIPKRSQGLPGGAAVNSRWMVLGDCRSRDFPLPDKFCKRTEVGCKSQDLDARKEQRWQEIPNQWKIQLGLGQMQRRKWRHKQRQRKTLSRRAAQEVRSVRGFRDSQCFDSDVEDQSPGDGQELAPQRMISQQLSLQKQSSPSGMWDQQLPPPTAALAKKIHPWHSRCHITFALEWVAELGHADPPSCAGQGGDPKFPQSELSEVRRGRRRAAI